MNYSKCLQYLDSAQSYSKYTPSKDVRRGIYYLKYSLYQKKGDFEKALECYRNMESYNDSVDNNGHLQMLSELQLKYNLERNELQRQKEKNALVNSLAQKELDASQLRGRLAIWSILGIVIIAFILK